MKTWSAQELSAFLAATANDPLFRLAATTGMRRGELLGLRWRDVDLDGARLHVRQQYTRQGALGCAFVTPKSPWSIRDIDLDDVTTQTLREARPLVVGDALVFCWPDGTPYEPSVLDRRFSKARRDAGLPAIRLHDLRHTHAVLLLEAGVDALTVSRRLGHDSIQTTLTLYGHVTSKMREGAAARFGALLS
jgi:integrase